MERSIWSNKLTITTDWSSTRVRQDVWGSIEIWFSSVNPGLHIRDQWPSSCHIVKDPCKYALSTHLTIKAFNPKCQLTPKMPDKCKHEFLKKISNCYLSDNNCIKNFIVWPIVLWVGLQKVPSVNTLIGSCTNQVRSGCVHVSSRVLQTHKCSIQPTKDKAHDNLLLLLLGIVESTRYILYNFF